MTLADMENLCLFIMQQPGSNFSGSPTWSTLTNPAFSQAAVDFALNRGYERTIADLSDLEILNATQTITSVSQTYKYAIPGNGNPVNQMTRRVLYAPVGQSVTVEFEPGVRLISWEQFRRYDAAGYLDSFSFATVPQVCAVTPDRKNLQFWPGPASSGDIITHTYSPLPTASTSLPYLINESDVPAIPVDTHEAIVFYALSILWMKAREQATSAEYLQRYRDEIVRIKDNQERSSTGDRLTISDRASHLTGWAY